MSSTTTVKTEIPTASPQKVVMGTVFAEEGAEVCPHTGQVIIEKSVKVFGMPLFTSIIFGLVVMAGIIGIVIYNVDDINAKKMTLLQGTISIVCSVVYAIFVAKYEKSRKQFLQR